MSNTSPWRRRRTTRPTLLVAALMVVGMLQYLIAPVSQVAADSGTSQQVEQGRQLFAVGCASCHGLNAQGSEYGPVLVGVGGAAVDFQVSTGRMPMTADENQAFPKERQFNESETAAMAAYIASLGPGPAIPDPEQYTPGNLDASAVARGGELFRVNCAGCHNFSGAGGALPNGIIAPSLFEVDNRYLYEAMITGPAQMPVFADSVLRPQRKREMIAYINTLHQQPSPGGLPLGHLGPVSEGLWAWVIGMGGLVAFAVWIAARTARINPVKVHHTNGPKVPPTSGQ